MSTWTHPSKISDLRVAFGVAVVDRLMPPMTQIPDEFTSRGNRWVKVRSDWFFRGLNGAHWTPKPGIDQRAALRHLKAIQGSFEPKHEHKEAAVAYLLSLWFEDVTYEAAS